ncbi:MAG: hypothetical protein JXA73_24985 [Acidobacteria bacterium]|nr:hypothetical protein [Acidobacteriota bacterium]
MPSAQDCAERLREQAYRTLLPQVRELEQELQSVNSSLKSGFEQVQRKLESIQNIELPTTELILNEILDEVIRQRNAETDDLVLFAREVRGKETQEELLSFLLDAAHLHFPRVAIFAVRGNRLIGWSSRGFSEELARNITSCAFFYSEYSQFQDALESDTPMPAPDLPADSPIQFLFEAASGPWSLLSLRVLQRPVALILANGSEGIPYKTNALSVMAGFAALRLENIALKILYELTAVSPGTAAAPTAEEAAVAAPPAAQPEPSTAVAVEEPIAVEPQSTEPALETAPAPDILPAQEPELQPEAAPVTAAAEAFEIPGIQLETPEPLPEKPKVEPQKVRPLPEEEKLHADAKRFARLLVSEIKLYNEKHVIEGRGNHDLYLRLKRDIDRSREMYEKRISPIVSGKIDYFHDEIIRILGDNDPSTLGSDYPGPRVES